MNTPINLSDHRSRVDIVTARRKQISARRAELRELQQRTTDEMNRLYLEDRELEQAEATIRKLMAKTGQ